MLDILKEKIDALLLSREKLKQDNQQLHQEVIRLNREKAELLYKNQQAADSIKRILADIGKYTSDQ